MILLQLIDRILTRIEGWLIIAMLSLMVIFTFFQVVLRGLYTHGHLSWANTLMGQIDWSEPLVRLLILWITFLGASLLTRDGKHIQIDLFASILPPRWVPLRDCAPFHRVRCDLCRHDQSEHGLPEHGNGIRRKHVP